MRREVKQERVNHAVLSGLEDSEERCSQGELLLYAPQGLGALHQLLLLFGLQCHVDHIRQAAVAQDTRDAQEDLILHSVQALEDERSTARSRLAGHIRIFEKGKKKKNTQYKQQNV